MEVLVHKFKTASPMDLLQHTSLSVPDFIISALLRTYVPWSLTTQTALRHRLGAQRWVSTFLYFVVPRTAEPRNGRIRLSRRLERD